MSHGLTFAQWIDSCPNKINCKDTNRQCLQVIHDFLTTVKIGCTAYDQSRQYFSKLSQPLTESVTNPTAMLRDFRKLRKKMNEIVLNFNDSLVTFVESSHTTEPVTCLGWRRERVTALDQYARFLCGIDSKFALQADYIRTVYCPRVETARRNNEPYEIEVLNDLIIIDAVRSNVVKPLTTQKFMQQAGVSGKTKIDGVTWLHFG